MEAKERKEMRENRGRKATSHHVSKPPTTATTTVCHHRPSCRRQHLYPNLHNLQQLYGRRGEGWV